MNILVTGAVGFIGTHIVEQLIQCGHNIRAWDVEFPEDYCPVACQVVGDILDDRVRSKAVAGCDAVVHACYSGSMEPLDGHFDINTVGSYRLLSGAVANKVKCFIFLSTYLLYNPDISGTRLFSEIDPVFPRDFYTATKHAIEGYCRAFQATSELNCVILRLAAVYGLRRQWSVLGHCPYTKQMVAALRNEKIEVYGRSPLISAYDVARSIAFVLKNCERISGSYNVVDIIIEWDQCAKEIVDMTGSNSRVISIASVHKPIIITGDKLKSELGIEFRGLAGFKSFLHALKEKTVAMIS